MTQPFRPSLVAFSTCALLCGVASGQQGGEITGNSARTAGMAGAGLAGGEELPEAIHNPAMIGFVLPAGSGLRFDSSLRYVDTPATIAAQSGRRFELSDTAALAPFLALGSSFGDSPLAWSLQIVPTAGGNARTQRWTTLNVAADENPPGSGVFVERERLIEIENSVVQVAFEPTLSYRPHERLSWGIGLSLRDTEMELASATEFPLERLAGAAPPPLAGLGATWGEVLRSLGQLGGRDLDAFQVEYDSEATADLLSFLKLGVAYELPTGTRVGVWLRPPSSASDIDGTVVVDLEADLGDIIRATFGPDAQTTSTYDLTIEDVRFPAQVGIAFAQPMGRRDTVHVQAIWTQWSKSFDGWEARLQDGSSDIFNEMLGGDGSTTLDLANVWNDVVSVSVGWERQWRQTVGRIGVGYSSNFVGGSAIAGLVPFNNWHLGTGMSYYPSGSRSAWHFGLVVALSDKFRVEEDELLSDFSGDEYRQASYGLALGYTLRW